MIVSTSSEKVSSSNSKVTCVIYSAEKKKNVMREKVAEKFYVLKVDGFSSINYKQ